MLRKCIITTICFIFIFYNLPVQTKICQDVVVINVVSSFERHLRNCTIIAGYLKIILIENATSNYEDISFPELIEIEGYLLLYRVAGLRSLGKLFPNLSVIRGYKLVMDYSLVIYDISNLEEIGLHNLEYIARGSVRIEKCPRLCYVETVNWSKILNPVHDLHYFDVNDIPCQQCASRCNGFCWNHEHCQTKNSDKCDQECVRCKGKGAKQCISCKSYKDGQTCVDKCPENKVPHLILPFCVTTKECSELLHGSWWIYKGECRNSCPYGYRNVSKALGYCEYCGDSCPKECPSAQVDSIDSAEQLRGCVRIKGDLTIRINSKATVDVLEQNLGMIEVIDNFLKIYRSYPLTTLDFFTSLKVIRGISLYNDRYALVVYENPSLHKLKNWDHFTIEKGSILFHYNSQLCTSEIEALAKQVDLNYSTYDVSPYSNGDKRACRYITLNVTITELTSTSATFEWEDFTISNKSSYLIGYLFYYTEDPSQNMTIYNERDECDEDNWNSIFVTNTTLPIENLNAYAQYAYYIKTYVTLPSLGGQTTIAYFTTLSDDPSNLNNVEAISESSDSITLKWKTPTFPKGVLSHYVIVTYFEKDDPKFIARRNYCIYPHHAHTEETTKIPPKDWFNSVDNSTCSCNEETKVSTATFDSLCERFDIMDLDMKYSGCKRYTYSVDSNDTIHINNENISIIVFEEKHRPNLVKRAYVSVNTSNILEMNITNPNLTSYVIKYLKHFSMYVILLKACNSPIQCSGPEMVSQRTLKKENADDIPSGLSIYVENYDAVIKWPEPKDPNSVIVAYHLEYKKTDLENAKAVTKCITQQKYAYFGYKYRIRNFPPGQYLVRVKAVSLAGFGKFSDVIEFEISPPSHGTLTIIFVILVISVLFIPISMYCYYRYKRRNSIDQLHLIAHVNSSGTGSDYVEDEWEMDRNNVEIFKELGQGTFGMVYNGLIKSENLPCAVKTINEQANVHERISFLNEASVMKSFSNAHHVVKLLGVVSRGHPPLVVMELMERGDLKSLLRRSRSSSNNITCAEMYRMAAEIADGMMYLSARKFVHRDLAARNCMVSADHTVKIGDFGMTRDIYETDYYRKEAGGLMPIRWMSPESLADGVFTSDSDVWSYGIVLWEIVTLAEQPYQGLANEQVLQFVTAQGTLERPLECPDLLYEIMEACWKWRPNHRPLFKDIVEKLEPHIGQHFKLVSFYHSSDGEEYRINPRDRIYNPPALTVAFNRNTAVYWDAMQDDFSF